MNDTSGCKFFAKAGISTRVHSMSKTEIKEAKTVLRSCKRTLRAQTRPRGNQSNSRGYILLNNIDSGPNPPYPPPPRLLHVHVDMNVLRAHFEIML